MSYRDFSGFDVSSLAKDIKNSDLDNHNKFINLENALSLDNNILKSLLDKHAPIKTKRKSDKIPKWWNSGCQQTCTVRRQAKQNLKHKRS